MGWFIRTPEEARKALDKADEERDQRFLAGMSPEQRQKTLDTRARQARATQYMDGPQATKADRLDFYGRKHKIDAAWRAGKSSYDANLTPAEDDVVEKAYRQADNEMKREASRMHPPMETKKKGGKVCGMKKGGKVRGCGIAERGLTKGKMR